MCRKSILMRSGRTGRSFEGWELRQRPLPNNAHLGHTTSLAPLKAQQTHDTFRRCFCTSHCHLFFPYPATQRLSVGFKLRSDLPCQDLRIACLSNSRSLLHTASSQSPENELINRKIFRLIVGTPYPPHRLSTTMGTRIWLMPSPHSPRLNFQPSSAVN